MTLNRNQIFDTIIMEQMLENDHRDVQYFYRGEQNENNQQQMRQMHQTKDTKSTFQMSSELLNKIKI